jgi:O-antigen chain-terminating methyltransferase
VSTESVEGFYRAFENRFRGSRELIKSRLRVYLPIIDPLRQFDVCPAALDLGCGRGEWLEVLTEAGFKPYGIDLDEAMLEAARMQGLHVTCADAIDFLRHLSDESQFIVSGFHIAEHLEFQDLQTLVKESLRVLRPGGFLILETPNPENIRVGTSSFYLDPTHQRPLPPGLLSFLPDYYGFARVKILRLQEARGLAEAQTATLLDVLTQVSPDYAVVAQKAGEATIMAATQIPLEIEYGVDLEHLAGKFDATHLATMTSLTESATLLRGIVEGDLKHKNELLAHQQSEIERLRLEIASLVAQVHEGQAQQRVAEAQIERLSREHEAQQQAAQEQIEGLLREQDAQQRAAEERIEKLLQENEGYRKSRSWRLTAPLRAVRSLFGKRP